MRGHSWRSETMGRNGQRDRNNYHRGGVCCTVIKVCQSFNDFFKLFFIFYRICKNVLFWTFVQKSLVVIFKNNFGKNVSDSYFTCLSLNSGFLNYFFQNQKCGTHPSVLKNHQVFLEVHFYSAVETFTLNSDWLVRNVVVWTVLSKAWWGVALKVMKEDDRLSYNNLQGNDVHWLCWDMKEIQDSLVLLPTYWLHVWPWAKHLIPLLSLPP